MYAIGGASSNCEDALPEICFEATVGMFAGFAYRNSQLGNSKSNFTITKYLKFGVLECNLTWALQWH